MQWTNRPLTSIYFMEKLLPVSLAVLFSALAMPSHAEDRRGDFWLDAPIHFQTAKDPLQKITILPPAPEREKDADQKTIPPPPPAVVADTTKKTTGDSSVLARLAEAGSANIVLLPGFQKEWKLGPGWELGFDLAVEGATSAPSLWLVDADNRIAKGRLPKKGGGEWQKIKWPLSALKDAPKDFAFDRIARAVLVFDAPPPAKAWLDAVRFVAPSEKNEIALTDQLTSLRMAEESATREARLKEIYSRSRPAPPSPKELSGKPLTRRNDFFDIFSKLYLNEDVADANRRLLEILTTKDPALRAQYGLEYTWALSTTPSLYRFYFNFGSKSKRFPGRLTPEVEKKILETLWERNLHKNDIALARESTWNLTGSENHDCNAKVGSLLTSQIFMGEPEYASRIYPDLGTGGGYGYWFHRTAEAGRFVGAEGRAHAKDGKKYNSKDHYEAWVAFWKEYLRERARRGFFVEKNSPGYMGYTLSFIQDLYDFSEDAGLKKMAGMFLDLFWSEWAQDQLGGVRGGGKTRVNDAVPNGMNDRMYAMTSFFFGGLGSPNGPMNGLWLTDYRPPAIVWSLALNREALGTYAYVSRTPGEEPGKLPRPPGMERTLICDADSRLLRYSWVTPDYILGSQMDHPLAIQSHLSPSARWHGMIFSDSFKLVFPRAVAQRKGDGKWVSNGRGTPYHALQSGPVLITQQTRGFTIVNPEWFPGGQSGKSDPYGVYLSPDLGHVEEDQGWVFVEEGNAYLAIRVLSGNYQATVDTSSEEASDYQGSESLEEPLASQPFTWNDDRTLMLLKDRHAPVLFEAGRRADYPMLADFKKHIFGNKLALNKIAVPGLYTITYTSGGNTCYFNAANGELPYVNGKPIDYAPLKTFDSPYLSGNYRSGVVTVTDGKNTMTLDFENAGGDPARIAAAREAMEKATAFMRSISTGGGYVYKYSPDLKKRTAERTARDTQIAIQPPGTPSMGMAFLRAYEATHASVHLEAARAAATALARCQLASGGWHATADFDPARPNEDRRLYDGEKMKFGQIIKHTIGTSFDDDTTQSAVRFLLEFARAAKSSREASDAAIDRAIDRAIAGMMRAQYPNGAWPQIFHGEPRDPRDFPVKKAQIPKDYPRTWPNADYTGYYTLNDNCQSNCVKTMLLAYRMLGKPELLESARRGADFLLLAQLPEPQPAWAQQYNFNMEPAWARSGEPPSVCSCESGGVIQALIGIHLETGDEKYLEAAAPAVAWLQRSMIGKNGWSRLYELGTNKPIYGDARGQLIYQKEEIQRKFATGSGYTWESKFKIPEVLAEYERVKSQGRETALAAAEAPRKTLPELESSVDRIISALDSAGRWITEDRWWRKDSPVESLISTKAYIENIETLADYLIRVAPPAP